MSRPICSTIVAVALACAIAGAQTTFVSEDFATASGAQPPGGWSTSFVPGLAVPPERDGWVFDNPSNRSFPAPFAEPFAIVDSDLAGFGTSQDALMDSPRIDVSGAGTLFLHLDQAHRAAGGSTVEIFVHDGVGYNSVHFSSTSTPDAATTGESDPLSIDITAAAGGSTDAFVRLRYTGSFGWWWTVDNVDVVEPVQGNDVGVTAILGPVFGDECGALPASNVVSIEVTNFAAAPLMSGTMIPVAFRVDGGAVITETLTIATSLTIGAAATYTFAATADLSAPGLHVLDAFTSLAGDVAPSNDGATMNYLALPALGLPFAEDFDSVGIGVTPPSGWINDQNDNGGGLYDDWFFSTGGTPSGVGPTADHTGGGTFAFIEDSLASSHAAINLISPCIDLSSAVEPALLFWVWSNDPTGPSNTLSVDVVEYPGGAVTPAVVGPIGNLSAPEWKCRGGSLSAFNGSIVRLVFRGRNDNLSNFAHDISFDDVFIDELAIGGGQAPSPGIAVMDIGDALVGGCLGVESGLPGPYYTTIAGGTSIGFEFSGAPNETIILLEGLLNPGNAIFPVVGKLDLGTATFQNINLIADGTAGGFFNTLFITGPGGETTITFPAPLLLIGQTFNFQGAIFNAAVGPRFTNTVSVSFQ